MKKNLVVILGPTGVGKTDVTLSVASHLGIPVINADSRQIFAELPVGTAAPTPQQQSMVKHYFVGNRHIKDSYSASMFENDVMRLLDTLFATSQVALMSGGSMMYIDAVCKGLDDIPTVRQEVRQSCMDDLEEKGLAFLLEELKVCDPDYYGIVDRNNWRRVVHAVEIYRQTGLTFTSFRLNSPAPRPFRILRIGLDRPREEMYDRINARVLKMMDDGLLDEARSVYPFKGLQSLDTVGYRELFDYFDGKTTLSDAVMKIQSDTRRYMRKQITWYKRDDTIKWFKPDELPDIIDYIDKFLQTDSDTVHDS